MDKEYWEKFYVSAAVPDQPSDFARFIFNEYKESCGIIFDLGSGNGRDSIWFATMGLDCVGIEQSHTAVNESRLKAASLGLDTTFRQDDFSKCDFDSLSNGDSFSVYSRFTLHAVGYDEESSLLKNLSDCNHLRYVFIEVRSVSDSLYGQGKKVGPHEFITSHYRRFIDPEELKSKLSENFMIEFFEERTGFAKIKSEDPCLIRAIVKKQ